MSQEPIQVKENENLLYPFDAGKDACGVGFVANMKNKKSHEIVMQGVEILLNLDHRGACGCEVNTGDGAGILIQIPDKFFRKNCAQWDIKLPAEGDYAVGAVFLPSDSAQAKICEDIFERIIKEEGQTLLGWRLVPTVNVEVGPTARSCEPLMKQVFIGKSASIKNADSFERKLFLIRKQVENAVDAETKIKQKNFFYIATLSCRTIGYKGMLTTGQVAPYFPDLRDPDMESAVALVHSRFSTNTFPSWDLAHPFRYIAHNGEINTLRGNTNWMIAREALFESEYYTKAEMKKILPILREGQSDSAVFDNALEILVMGGRSLPHAIMMLIPEAWQGHATMPQYKKDFYHYHSCLMEPWDGPASVAFTDGQVIGAILDRNGLRPSRYYVTSDDMVVMASEVGVLDIDPKKVIKKGRLEPGKMFLIDLKEGRIVEDVELKERIAKEQPYGEWLKQNLTTLENLPEAPHVPQPDHDTVLKRQKAFGYTHEDVRILMAPMATNGEEAIGSMGDDTPMAVLSDKNQPLFNYFRQLFAQVTNPPLDAIREELVTSVNTTIGPEGNILKPTSESCRQIELKSPVLDNDELAKFSHISYKGYKAITLPILYRVADGGAGLAKAVDEVRKKASQAAKDGYQIIILSDRGLDHDMAPIPSLLATAGVHHHLIKNGERTKVGLIIESGEPREVHHFAMLLGYGANAINPYLAFETVDDMIRRGILPKEIDHKTAVKKYIKAANKGIVKVMSKMGISTIQSYRGAQIFEAVGLNKEFINKYFTWTQTRIEGIGINEVATETEQRHRGAFPERPFRELDLEWGGRYQWRRDGEKHLFNPDTIHKLQTSVKTGNYKLFKDYSKDVNEQSKALATLRGLFKFKAGNPIAIEDVQPTSEIVKRFASGAMSYGSISKEAHETMAIAMNRLGGKSNTGEGGEDEDRYTPDANGDSRNSAIKQVASGRFGVTSHYLVNAKEIQIKMAQGAKPGEGGQLPAKKVYPWIAKTRHATAFVGLISPPPHHDIYSIEDLAQLIHDLKNANKNARISVKLVSEVGVGTVAAGVTKAHADHVLISGHDGGTGASPLTSLKYAGAPWELGLAETHQILVKNKLRDRIVVQTDGQLKTGRDVAIACLLGAEEFGFATAALVAEGCIMMRVCHLDTCPVGIATQNPELRKKFTGKPEYVVNFMTYIAQELREIMAELGFKTINDMVGHSELLETNEAIAHWKSKGLDFSPIFYKPEEANNGPVYCTQKQDHGLDKALDNEVLIERCKPALDEKKPVKFEVPIRNINRTVGTMLGAEISRKHGSKGLPDDTIQITFRGSAGQSFGAFAPKGLTMRLVGDANDYVGKGMCGGKIIVTPPTEVTFIPEENIIVGNVLLYGATAGEAYFRGRAGERFGVRNSGVNAVVEGVGDHGCEYMTGGHVVVIGETGRNFAAGMSGGIAYVWNKSGDFNLRCNKEMVELEPMDSDDVSLVQKMLQKHLDYTGSTVAAHLLKGWDQISKQFVKVMPIEYKKALQAQKETKTAPVAVA